MLIFLNYPKETLKFFKYFDRATSFLSLLLMTALFMKPE